MTEHDLLSKGFKKDPSGSYSRIKIPSKPPKTKPIGLSAIENILQTANIPFDTEYKFHPTRKWRFDIAIPQMMLAIEYEGIFSKKSRHTSLNGYTEDSNKYNAAQILGWHVLRYTAQNHKNFLQDLQYILSHTSL